MTPRAGITTGNNVHCQKKLRTSKNKGPVPPLTGSVNLGHKGLGDRGLAACLQDMLKKEVPAKPAGLHLQYSSLTNKGAEALANALESGLWRFYSRIILKNNNIGDQGAKYLWDALLKVEPKNGFMLDLSGNMITNGGLISLGSVLKSKDCPLNLHIILQKNIFTDAGVKNLCGTLSGINTPRRIKLDISNNFAISQESVNILIAMLDHAANSPMFEFPFPIGMELNIQHTTLNIDNQARIDALVQKYAKKYDEYWNVMRACLQFCKGTSEQNSIVRTLPIELIIKICHDAHPDFLKDPHKKLHTSLASMFRFWTAVPTPIIAAITPTIDENHDSNQFAGRNAMGYASGNK